MGVLVVLIVFIDGIKIFMVIVDDRFVFVSYISLFFWFILGIVDFKKKKNLYYNRMVKYVWLYIS